MVIKVWRRQDTPGHGRVGDSLCLKAKIALNQQGFRGKLAGDVFGVGSPDRDAARNSEAFSPTGTFSRL